MELADLIGRVVAEATAAVHAHPESDDTLLFVRLDFTDGTGVRFGTASDGQSLCLDAETLNSYDMAELGRVDVRPLEKLSTQERLEEAVPLIDGDGLTFGVLLTTATSRVFVFNWGDELYAEPQLPDVVRRESGRSLPS